MKSKEALSYNQAKVGITCECGYKIRGNSDAHAKALLKQHQKSNLHKVMMSAKISFSSGAITIKQNEVEQE